MGVEQSGQVRLAILETNGRISVYFFEDDKVKPGLLILPSDCTQRYKLVPESAGLCLYPLQWKSFNESGGKTMMSALCKSRMDEGKSS